MVKKDKKAIVKYGESRLKANVKVGMRGVDPADIRPPRMLLLQKSSELSQYVDVGGVRAKVGQFFHTGKLNISDTFQCYFVFAAKTKYTDKRKQEEGEKDQYQAIGVMADDLSLFAMVFRSSSLYTLSPLFSVAASLSRPMYSFLCEIETKELSGDKGTWFIPVLRIKKPEKDPGKLVLLEEKARALDLRADNPPPINVDEVDRDLSPENY